MSGGNFFGISGGVEHVAEVVAQGLFGYLAVLFGRERVGRDGCYGIAVGRHGCERIGRSRQFGMCGEPFGLFLTVFFLLFRAVDAVTDQYCTDDYQTYD